MGEHDVQGGAIDQAAEAAGITLAKRPEPTQAINDVVVEVRASGFVPGEWERRSTWVDRSGHDRAPDPRSPACEAQAAASTASMARGESTSVSAIAAHPAIPAPAPSELCSMDSSRVTGTTARR